MPLSLTSLSLARPTLTTIGAALALGCMDYEGLEGEREISTHVDDWRDQVIYQLMVDRFANGDLANDYRVRPGNLARYQGGDWRGVEENLDYLAELGVTAIWISPIIKNVEEDAAVDGYHGYWQQDFTKTNPHFGDVATLRRLVDRAHDRGILVILDIVTNHVGQLFYYDMNLNGAPDERVSGSGFLDGQGRPPTSEVGHLNEYDPDYDPAGVQAFTSLGRAGPAPILFVRDALSNHMPPEPEIFQQPFAYNRRGRIWDYDVREQVEKGDFPGGLKDLNTLDRNVRAALIDVFARWVELADLDGFRIDTLKHVEHEFWQGFAAAIRKRLAAKGKTKFFMFGEAFDGDDALVGSYTKDGEVDSTFYFPQHFRVYRDVFQDGRATREVERLFEERKTNYGAEPHADAIGVAPQKALVNFIDNHDVPRFLWKNSIEKLENALLFMFTEDGIPCLYYGTEQGFSGGNDPANRENLWTSGYSRSHRLYRFIARLAKIRRTYPALTRGDLALRWVTDRVDAESDAGILAFERASGDAGDSKVLVVINTHSGHESRTSWNGSVMTTTFPEGTRLVDALDPAADALNVGPMGTLDVQVPATKGKILVPEP